ncbi:MAM and LDL-receptor class A domain-containing protein 2-like [Xenia sp. Carnegie-2017]|uniref:MAM and LDL-receptor class A domain-containing protein 2-like n=1 Tax=Xenia sp. Carnegie-2017 TaxID=2897299 RepID=UPI001F03F87C|nr:MAM and LDL-receptor class A domain-containing protein 2-like [Xenia sp. Carnegie-2017]
MMMMMMICILKDTSTSSSLTMIDLTFFLLVSTTLSRASVDSKVCDFEHGLGTNLCPWYNVEGIDYGNWIVDNGWILGRPPTFGQHLSALIRRLTTGKIWLVGNYRNDSLVCFSFSYFMYSSYFGTLNIYQEYFRNGYNLLLWSLSGDQGTKWKKGQVTVNFAMGLSRLIVEAVVGPSSHIVAIDNLAFASGSCDTIPKVAIPNNAIDCSIGSFFSFESKNCEKCPIYTYQPYPKQTRCLTCNDGKGTINVRAVSEKECIKVKRCDFQKGLGTTLCPWHNVEGDGDFDWKLRTSSSAHWQPPRYDATGFSVGRYVYAGFRYYFQGKAWLLGNYSNNSVMCFSFSYYMGRGYYGTLNIYQEYFHNGYSPLLWSLSGDKGTKWKKGQVTVNFTMGLSRLIVEAVVPRFTLSFVALDNLAFAPGSCGTIPKEAIPINAFDCSNGLFFSFLNKKCNKCPSSTYQPYTNQTRCLTCNDGKGTINIGAVSEQECIKVENCDFQKGLGTTVCPWHNVEGDDDLNWALGAEHLTEINYRNPSYDATGSNFGRYLYTDSSISGRAWLVGNYQNDSLVCFSFSYYIRGHNILNIYQEYFHNSYNVLLWSLSGDQVTKWKKGQVTVNFTMGLSRLMVEAVVRGYTINIVVLDNLAFAPGSCDTIPKVAIPSNVFKCSIGSFFSFESKKCEKCPIYTYQPYPKQTRCLPCNDGKGTINVGAVSEQECIKVTRCDFQEGLGTTECPWHNVEGDDNLDWKFSTSYSSNYEPPRYDATGFSIGQYLSAGIRHRSTGKIWLVGNYRNDSLVCFSFSYYIRSHYHTLNIYEEYFHNGYSPLLWSLSGYQGTKWKKGQVTVNFTMGLSRLIVEAIVSRYTTKFVALDNLAFAPGSCDTIPKVAIPNNAFDCSNGSFFSFLNKKCNKCPSSTYQPYTNQTRCLTCNDGKGTINIGAVSEQECIKGNF